MVSPLDDALALLAEQPQVLICCDYDGTLAPIVANPADAVPFPDVVDVLYDLAVMPGLRVALVSGRAMRDLRSLSGVDERVTLVGSHGAEFVEGQFLGFGPVQQRLLDELAGRAESIVGDAPGAMVEYKPTSFAVHVRNADPADADRVMAQVAEEILSVDGIFITHGKKVVEVAVIHADKGEAISELRDGAAVLFVGDDVTDERGFAALRARDVGIKVGLGDSAAQYRVPDPAAVKALLEQFARLRGSWAPEARS
ncbi:MAG: trehalose-phosphatase [Actinobacteria bacterium]|nr:trehalose-phosphatase [Actinomycetota bacterium]